MVEKMYYVTVESCNPFTGSERKNVKFKTLSEALSYKKKFKGFCYAGNDYYECGEIRHFFYSVKERNNHNFYTKPNDRLRKIKVIGWDDSVCGYIVDTTNNVLKDKELEEHGWYYNSREDQLQTYYIDYNMYDLLQTGIDEESIVI